MSSQVPVPKITDSSSDSSHRDKVAGTGPSVSPSLVAAMPGLVAGGTMFPDAVRHRHQQTAPHSRRSSHHRSSVGARKPNYRSKQERNSAAYKNKHAETAEANKILHETLLKRTLNNNNSRFDGNNPTNNSTEKDTQQKQSQSPTKGKQSLNVRAKKSLNKDADTLESTMGFCGNTKCDVVDDEMMPFVGKVERMEDDCGADACVASSSSGVGSLDCDAMRSVAPPVYGENAVEDLYATLREYLAVEGKFQPKPVLPVNPQRGEISAGTRDGAAHVLRCLKIWYDLPTDVHFHAINLLDRFLTKMKVRPCHVSCISVSCMNMAIQSHRPALRTINTEDLVSISQCKCTVGDVRRMSAVIGEKLGAVGDAITPLHWLRLLGRLLAWASPEVVPKLMQETDMVNRLEILSCDASCCNIRSCELAFVLLCTQLDSQLTVLQRAPSAQNEERMAELTRLVHFAMELQRVCQIGDESFYSSHQAVVSVLERYNARQKMPHRQRLVWRLSSRTLKVLRPTDRLTSLLPTIEEQQMQSEPNRQRSGSESSDDLSEESADWPTSPLVPVLCHDH